MISSRRSWLVLLIVAGLLLSSVAPAFAQDEEPAEPDGFPAGNHYLFLPSARNDAVTVLTIPAEKAFGAARATAQRTLPASVAAFKLAQPIAEHAAMTENKMAPELRQAQDRVSVVVQLAAPSLLERQAAKGISGSAFDSAFDAAATVNAAAAQQSQLVASAKALDEQTVVLG